MTPFCLYSSYNNTAGLPIIDTYDISYQYVVFPLHEVLLVPYFTGAAHRSLISVGGKGPG